MNKYQDILNMEHYELKYHPRMNRDKRAAQFAPFAALTGYEESVRETARRTTTQKKLTEDAKELLDYQLQILSQEVKKLPTVKITYFEKDKYKAGGKYLEYTNQVKQINMLTKELVFLTNRKVKIENIIQLEIQK